MPKPPLRTHDLGSIFVIVGTNHITAWGESGGIMLKPNADIASIAVGRVI